MKDADPTSKPAGLSHRVLPDPAEVREFQEARFDPSFHDYEAATNAGTRLIDMISPILMGDECLLVTGYQDLLAVLSIIIEVRPGIVHAGPGTVRVLLGTNADAVRAPGLGRDPLPRHVSRHYMRQSGLFARDPRDLVACRALPALRSGAIRVRVFDEALAQEDLRFAPGLLHANLFVSEDFAVSGSAPFSRRGLAGNLEFSDKVLGGSAAHIERARAAERFWGWGRDWSADAILLVEELLRAASPRAAFAALIDDWSAFWAAQCRPSRSGDAAGDLARSAVLRCYEHGIALVDRPLSVASKTFVAGLEDALEGLRGRLVMDDGATNRTAASAAGEDASAEVSTPRTWTRNGPESLVFETPEVPARAAPWVVRVAPSWTADVMTGDARAASHVLGAGGDARVREIDDIETRMKQVASRKRVSRKARDEMEADRARLIDLTLPWRTAPAPATQGVAVEKISIAPGEISAAAQAGLVAALKDIEAKARRAQRGGEMTAAQADGVMRDVADLRRALRHCPVHTAGAWRDGHWARLREAAVAAPTEDFGDMFALAAREPATEKESLIAEPARRLHEILEGDGPAALWRDRWLAIAGFFAGARSGLVVVARPDAAGIAAGALAASGAGAVSAVAGDPSDGIAIRAAHDIVDILARDGGIGVVRAGDLDVFDRAVPERLVLVDAEETPEIAARALELALARGPAPARMGVPESADADTKDAAAALVAQERAHIEEVTARSAGAVHDTRMPDMDGIGGMFAIREIEAAGDRSAPDESGTFIAQPVQIEGAVRRRAEIGARNGGSGSAARISGGALVCSVPAPVAFMAYYLSGSHGGRRADFMPPRLLVVEEAASGAERVLRDQARAFGRICEAVDMLGDSMEGDLEGHAEPLDDPRLLDRISRHMACLTHWDLRPERVARVLADLARVLDPNTPAAGEEIFGDLSLASLELVADRWMAVRQGLRADVPACDETGALAYMRGLIEEVRFGDRDRSRGVQDRVSVVIAGRPDLSKGE